MPICSQIGFLLHWNCSVSTDMDPVFYTNLGPLSKVYLVCQFEFARAFSGGRAIARARAGTRPRLRLGAINHAPSNKHFLCVERDQESDNRYDPLLSSRLAHLRNSF